MLLIQSFRFLQEIEAAAEFWVAMEALQCRNAAVWAMSAKAAAGGEGQGRAVRIPMSRNGAQVLFGFHGCCIDVSAHGLLRFLL